MSSQAFIHYSGHLDNNPICTTVAAMTTVAHMSAQLILKP
jgi:hypothetical protein